MYHVIWKKEEKKENQDLDGINRARRGRSVSMKMITNYDAHVLCNQEKKGERENPDMDGIELTEA